jgi:hypothetical protein
MNRLLQLLKNPPGPPEPDADGIVRAPSEAPPERFARALVRIADPGD